MAARDALTVPATGLVRAGNKSEIYLVTDGAVDPPRGIGKRLEAQVGIDEGLRVEPKNDTLTGRALVIVRGAGVLRAGDPVIAVPAKQAD